MIDDKKERDNYSEPENKRPVDELASSTLLKIKNSYLLVSRKRVATWKGIIILAFFAGIAMTTIWFASNQEYSTISRADENISNTASVVYQDADGSSYGPTSSNTFSTTITTSSDDTGGGDDSGNGTTPTPDTTPEEGKVPYPPVSDPDYPEGTLLKTPESFKIYVIIDDKKKWIPTPEVFETLGYEWTSITELNLTTLKSIPNYEDNLIRAIGNYKVYLVVNGIKRHIPNPEIFLNYGFAWEDVVDVPQSTIDKYTRAYLIRESRQGTIYYLRSDGVKKWIRNPEIFASYNNEWEDIQVISKPEMDSYPESNLIQFHGDDRIYLIEGNVKRHIPSASVFNKYGYNWEHVIIVNEVEFEWYGEGSMVR
jgi:hypothetical protein